MAAAGICDCGWFPGASFPGECATCEGTPRRGRGECHHCGKPVARGPGSRERIVCRQCRRDGRTRIDVELECCVCGAAFVPTYDIWKIPSLARPCCSRSCGQRLNNWRHGRAGGGHDACMRARRVAREMTWDGVPDEQIIERDGWRCRMPVCVFASRVIPRDAKYPDPRYRSVDHIVPLSVVPDDTAANKRAAHLRCNVARGNRMGAEQLPLFGTMHDVQLVTLPGRKVQRVSERRNCRRCGQPFDRSGKRVYCEVCRELPKPGRKLKGCRSCAGSGYEHAAGCLHLLTSAQRLLLGLRMSAMRSEGIGWQVIADTFGYKGTGAAYTVMAQALSMQPPSWRRRSTYKPVA